ncbi:MAG: motif family protein [Acidobacteriota bacterium]|nr:motif family protein [Acidobacteriota bacterium]
MSFQRILRGAGLALGLSLMLSAVAFAQQPMPPQQDGARRPMPEGRREGRGGPGKRGHGAMRLFRELNLTDAQREQIRGIQERAMASTKSQHDALRNLRENNQGQLSTEDQARAQALRAEIETAMKGAHQETLNVLTSEQRTQLEQLIQERKSRHKDRRGPGPGPGPSGPATNQDQE